MATQISAGCHKTEKLPMLEFCILTVQIFLKQNSSQFSSALLLFVKDLINLINDAFLK